MALSERTSQGPTAGTPAHRYVVEAERSGRWWALRVPELPGVFSQVRRLEQADAMVRDAIAAFLDIATGAIEVSVVVHLPDPLGPQVDEVLELRATLAADERRYAELSRKVATGLVTEGGLTVRDAGRVLGITHQRVAQLVER